MKQIPENFEYLKECPVCLSRSFFSFKKRTFNSSFLTKEHIKITDSGYGKIWDLCRCGNCTHTFANPCPKPAFIQSLYSKIEDPLYQEEALGRSKNFARILSFLEKFHPSRGNIFDVGAATGILMNIARERGWEPAGIEPSCWAVEVAAQKYDLQLYEGYFESARLKQNYYTSVTMVDFIEHIPCPLGAVRKAYEILASNGTLCVVTPDINSLAAKTMKGKWWHYRPAHLAYFSLESITHLLSHAGFRILKNRKYSWTFSAHYLISRLGSLNFLLKKNNLASFWKKIPIKLALQDSIEIYAIKEERK
ncbi:class I SAM-dependent methyltransferase [Acidobacteriota bacterium]